MKILHIITTADVGGAEMHILSQVRGQVARGHEVRVAYLLGQGTLRPDFLEAGAQSIECMGKSLAALWRLRAPLGWCDLVHTHLLRADFLGAAAALLWGRRRRLISGKHNDEHAIRRPWVARLHGWVGRLPKQFIVLSEHVKRYMQDPGRLRPERMVVIRYGIDSSPWEAAAAQRETHRRAIRAEFGWSEQDIVFVCVARLAHQKAHDVLLAATRQAADRLRARQEADAGAHDPKTGARPAAERPRIRLLVVGDDPFGDGRQRVTAWAREQNLLEDGTCVLAGIRRDVPHLLAASDVFIMPSRWEGLGLVFLEAMAVGLPVVSTAVSAIPEVVVPEETGVLVPVEQVDALADAMLRVATDPQARERFGQAGSARVARDFSLDAMVDRTLKVYESVLAGRTVDTVPGEGRPGEAGKAGETGKSGDTGDTGQRGAATHGEPAP